LSGNCSAAAGRAADPFRDVDVARDYVEVAADLGSRRLHLLRHHPGAE